MTTSFGKGRGNFNLYENNKALRKGKFLIVGLSVIGEMEDYEAVAIVINEDKEVESISIEGFDVEEGLTNIVGCYLIYEEDENDEYIGKIVKF